MSKIRLALVGYGAWGRNYIKAAEDSGEARVSVVTLRGDSIESAHCDAVVYAGHPAQAAERCEEALAEGLPILCEKPAGLSLADAERIAAAEAKSKAFVLVGHQHLFAEKYEEMVEWRRSNPATAHADWRGPGPARDYPALWDYGPHAVAALVGIRHAEHHWRFAPPIMDHAEVDDDKALLIWFMGTERVQARVSRVHDRKEARVYFWNGEEHGPSYDAYAPAEPPLTCQVRAFARAVRNGGTDDYRFGAKWAVDVARVLTAASSQ